VLVAELALELEHTEVVTADEIEVQALLVPVAAEVCLSEVGGTGVGEDHLTRHVLRFGEQDAALEADIAVIVVRRRRRSGDYERGCARKQIFAHLE
jgi:hypothetical protein